MTKHLKKRKSGITTGHAGEYFVMGELLRRGFDAQLADRNTKGYDLLAGSPEREMRRVQVKAVRAQPWFLRTADFKGKRREQVTVYVLVGSEGSEKPIRYFIAKNGDVAKHIYCPRKWKKNGFMPIKAVRHYENRWDELLT